MEKVCEDEEKTIGEASNSTEERSVKEDDMISDTIAERFDPVGSMDPSNSQTVNYEDHDVSEYEMEDEEVLELFRRNSGLRPKVTKSNNFPYVNKSEEMVLQVQEDTPVETEQANIVFHIMSDGSEIADLGAENLGSSVIFEGVRSSSDSKKETDDSSSSDSDLSSYYFDGSLPISAHAEELETHHDESPVPRDENQMPLLRRYQPVQQLTSWRNCCGLLELLRAAGP